MARRKRSRLEIIEAVLDYIAREGGEALATRIATANGLAYDRLASLLDELNAKGVVEVENIEGRKLVRITREGRKLLHALKEVRKVIRDFGLDV